MNEKVKMKNEKLLMKNGSCALRADLKRLRRKENCQTRNHCKRSRHQ
jgi:hypothetical protein